MTGSSGLWTFDIHLRLLTAGSFALAQIFRRGAELHDFEQLAV